MPVIEVLPIIEDIRVSRVKGKTLFEMVGFEPSLNYVCNYYLGIQIKYCPNQKVLSQKRFQIGNYSVYSLIFI